MKEKFANSKIKGSFKKRAFTLIELLAIIVILAIIAVITVPIILNIIDNSKKGAVIDSAYGYKDAIQNYYMSKSTNNASEEVPTGTYDVYNLPEDFKVSGETPTDGWIQFEKGKVVAYSLQFSDYVVTKEANSDPTAEKNGTITQSPNPKTYEIGYKVKYSTSLNGITLDNWKVFYKEGDYVYLIIGGYLPTTAINNEDLRTAGTYGVYVGSNRATLLDAMTNKSNWAELVTNGTIDGVSINQTVSDDVWAMGSPTIQLWVDSWNTLYPDITLYIGTYEYQGVEEYSIGKTENPSQTNNQYLGFADGSKNPLYFPYRKTEESCSGYWFASPSAANKDYIMLTFANSDMNYRHFYYGSDRFAFRPVIRLPYSVISK